MKNDRILNFLIAFFLTLIIFNLFLPKAQNTTVNSGIVFSTIKKSYTIPNLPEIQVVNYSSNVVKINTCKDLTIKKDGKIISDIQKDSPKFCTQSDIEPKKTYKVSLENIAKVFQNVGKYDFILKKDFGTPLGYKEYTTSIDEQEKGFFNSFFTSIFYAPVYNLFVLIINSVPGHSLGLSIIIVTLLIRSLVLVPQHKIMVNSKKMQAIQPKIKEIQEKYKGDKSKIGMELLDLYKKEKVNPMGSCLPLLLQLPLLIVLYWTISGISSAANYYYLYGPLSSFDVSKINPYFFGLDLVKQEWKSGLILAIFIGFFQWLQIKMSLTVQEKRKSHGKIIEKDVKVDDPISEFMPDPNVMNAFMLWGMPVMLAFSSYFFPSGVGIYWLIGTIFTLVQQYIVNKIGDKKITTKEGHEVIIPSVKKSKK